MTPAIVFLGNLLVDDLVFPDGRTRMAQPGGAILYGALGARLWGARVGLVSRLGTDYPAGMLDALQRAGIDLLGLRTLNGPGVRTWLLYEGPRRRMVHRLECPTHEAVSPAVGDVPVEWREAACFHLSPMPLSVQRRLLTALASSAAFVSVDPHEPVTEATLGEWRDALTGADAFFPGADELLLAGAAAEPAPLVRCLAGDRLRFVACKRGRDGGVLFDVRGQRVHPWASRTSRVQDPTGAGDAFAAGFLAAYLEGVPVERCLQRAVVTASFALEEWGPASLLAATRAEAEARLVSWYGGTGHS